LIGRREQQNPFVVIIQLPEDSLMQRKLIAITVLMLAASSMALAAGSTGKKVSEWTCEDFLAVKESFRPTVVGIGAVVSRDKVEDEVVDVDGIEKVTPELVQVCGKEPKASFLTKLKAEWEKVKKAM
jgi:acid stress chaperone HdeA